jgi:type IV fimbrial biogenesis protein FimT
MRTSRGFTVVELMISVSVLAILLALGIPSFREAGLSSQLRSSANDLLASARFARSEAIKQNSPVRLCVSSDGSTCGSGGWHQGWIVLKGTTVLQSRAAASGGMRITEAGGLTSVSFEPTGLGATSARFTVCRAIPITGAQERVVTIDASGRAHVRRTANAACP